MSKISATPFAVLLLVTIALASGQEPADCPGGDAPLESRSTRDLYKCSYGACFPVGHSDDNRPPRRCVHNSFFCSSDEVFVTAVELHHFPDQEPCFCEDILEYPATIGMCDLGGGITTPMVTQKGDCPDGRPLCRSTSAFEKATFYQKGDPRGVIGPAYTSCDMPCDAKQGQSLAITPGEFEGCTFPTREWVTGTVGDDVSFWPRAGAVADRYIFVTGDIQANNPEATPENSNIEDNLIVRGPYTSQDSTASNGSIASDKVYYPTFSGYDYYETDPRRFDGEIGLAVIDKDTGAPVEVMHLGNNYHAENSWAIDAKRNSATGALDIVLGGKFTGTLSAETETCVDASNALASTTCAQTGTGFTTTLSVNVNPNLDLDALPDSATADMGGMTTFVMALDMQDPAGSSMLRGIKWLVSPFSGSFNGNVRDVEIDSTGNVYVLGRECDGDPVVNPNPSSEDNCEVVLYKLSGTDGSVIMTKLFPFLYHAYELELDEEDGMLFFSSSMQDGQSSDDGTFVCNNNVVPDEVCSVTMAVDLEGNIIWARTLDHFDLYGFFTGSIMVAHNHDGPYVYVTYEESYDSLDQGTPYPVCINDATGRKTPVYEISMDRLVTSCPTGSTYHAYNSTEAMPARAALSGAICSGTTSNSCAIKYHKYTGLPIFGTAIAAARALGAGPDGILLAGSYYSETFSWAEQMAQTNLLSGPRSSVSYQALIDKDTGKGVYVQALAAPTGYVQTYSSVTDTDGNFYVLMGHRSNELYGDDFELKLPFIDGGYNSRHMLVEKYATGINGGTYVPSCIQNCANDNADNVIKDGKCYIANFCYDDGDTFAKSTGQQCPSCDVNHSPKEAFVPPGCLEEGETYAPTAPGAPTSAPPATPTPPSSATLSEDDSRGLTNGGKAGIAIASVFAFLFVAFVGLVSTGRVGIGMVRRTGGGGDGGTEGKKDEDAVPSSLEGSSTV